MNTNEPRQSRRDSLFLNAQLRIDGLDAVHRVKIRNLSARGLMAEGDVRVQRGAPVLVELRHIGWVEGTVAWKQDSRFGIAFLEEVDPLAARSPVADAQDYEGPRFARAQVTTPPVTDPDKLRKI